MSGDRLTVVIPTLNRPDQLLLAVRSVFAQTLAMSDRFAVVIVDNSPNASAGAVVETLQAECPNTIRLTVVYEPKPGVANARNAAIMVVDTDLVVYLDDDQTAPVNWLQHLLATYKEFPATVVFGAVVTALPKDIKSHRTYLSSFFGREPKRKRGYISEYYGTGNSLVDFSKVPGGIPYFDTSMNDSGGEDDILFARIRRGGGKFAWSSDNHVYEHPVRSRLSLNYTLRRAFAYGRAPVTMARKASPTQYLGVVAWMGIGAAKAIWHTCRWIGLILIGNKNHAFELDLAVRGIGKVLWFVDMSFYGNAVLKSTTEVSQPISVGTMPDISLRHRVNDHG